MKSLKKGAEAAGLLYCLLLVIEQLIMDMDKWYLGPAAKEVAGLGALALGYIRARRLAKKYGRQGEPPWK